MPKPAQSFPSGKFILKHKVTGNYVYLYETLFGSDYEITTNRNSAYRFPSKLSANKYRAAHNLTQFVVVYR